MCIARAFLRAMRYIRNIRYLPGDNNVHAVNLNNPGKINFQFYQSSLHHRQRSLIVLEFQSNKHLIALLPEKTYSCDTKLRKLLLGSLEDSENSPWHR